MNTQVWLAVGAVVFAGLLQGVFAVPMKYARRWSYENIWLAFCLSGMVVLPWLLTTLTVPHAGQVYAASSSKNSFEHCRLWRVLGDGCNPHRRWPHHARHRSGDGHHPGVVRLRRFAHTPPGSDTATVHTPQGHTYLIGTAIMLVGIAVCARAGCSVTRPGNKSKVILHRGRFGWVSRSAVFPVYFLRP